MNSTARSRKACASEATGREPAQQAKVRARPSTMQLCALHHPGPPAQLRAVLRAAAPLRRTRLPASRGGGVKVEAARGFWVRLSDGVRLGDRELRLKEVGKRESEQLSKAAAEHLTERGAVEEHVPSHQVSKATLTGVNNEPPPHHHDVPTIPARHKAVASELLPYPLPVRVRAPSFPAGVMVTPVRAPVAPMALEGPINTGLGLSAALLFVFAIVVLGRMRARRRDWRSPEEPLFRPSRRYPRWWWLP